jgi:enoyl-CoA hydratase
MGQDEPEEIPMNPTTIRFARDGPVATIYLNRPERMNAVIEAMYHEIQGALAGVRDDPEVRCLVITGSVLDRGGVGRQAFCAGADLKEHATGNRDPGQRRAYIRLAQDTVRRIAELEKPVVAAINGPARGAGAELALACDLILIAEEATIAFPETGLGTFVGGGVTHLLPRLVGLSRARELVYTGRVINGREAAALGLAVACVPVARLADEARALAERIAARAPMSMALAKRFLNQSPGIELGAVLDLEAEAILGLMESADWREGVAAFADKRRPVFTGR